ncbi:MAG: hypothetical protein ACFFKA_07880 [Candidatus Thorarchaeota archaeon]
MLEDIFDFNSFEHWFLRKLIEEKERRLFLIKNLWNNLNSYQRKKLIEYINDDFLLHFVSLIIKTDYNNLYLVVRDHIENSFEKIEEWEKNL